MQDVEWLEEAIDNFEDFDVPDYKPTLCKYYNDNTSDYQRTLCYLIEYLSIK